MGGTDNVQVPDRGKEKADAGQGSLTANAVQAEWRLTCGASPYHEAGSCDTDSRVGRRERAGYASGLLQGREGRKARNDTLTGDGQGSALPVLHAILVMPTPARMGNDKSRAFRLWAGWTLAWH